MRAAIRANPEDFVLSDAARAALDDLPALGVAGFFEVVKAAQAAGELGGFRDRVLKQKDSLAQANTSAASALPPAPTHPAQADESVQLLREIRDLLKRSAADPGTA